MLGGAFAGLLDGLSVGAEDDFPFEDLIARGARQHPRGRGLIVAGIGKRAADGAQALVRRRWRVDLRSAHGVADQLLQLDAEALAEGTALALAVVGEDDQAVGPWRLIDRLLQALELCVVLLEDRERVGLLYPGMVGDFVVADEGRVDDGDALDDVAEQGGDVEIAHHHRDRASDPRIEPAPVDVRRATPSLPASRSALEDNVP